MIYGVREFRIAEFIYAMKILNPSVNPRVQRNQNLHYIQPLTIFIFAGNQLVGDMFRTEWEPLFSELIRKRHVYCYARRNQFHSSFFFSSL